MPRPTKLHAHHIDIPQDAACGRNGATVEFAGTWDDVTCGNCRCYGIRTLAAEKEDEDLVNGELRCLIEAPVRRAPKSRITVPTRKERAALGTRKCRRTGTKAKSNRFEPENIHYQNKPALIFKVRAS
jgi:hypothetical protein